MTDRGGSAHLNVMSATTEKQSGLTAIDRCDRCGAQAYTQFEHPAIGALLFCVHHTRENEQALAGTGFIATVDDRHLLLN